MKRFNVQVNLHHLCLLVLILHAAVIPTNEGSDVQ